MGPETSSLLSGITATYILTTGRRKRKAKRILKKARKNEAKARQRYKELWLF